MDYSIENNTHECQDCGMKFYNAAELVNHMKKFCAFSGFDSLEGLAKHQLGKSFSKNNKKYQAASMGAMKYQPEGFTASQLARDAKDMEMHREQLQINRPYSNLHPNYVSNRNNGGSVAAQNRNNKYESSIIRNGSRILGVSDISMQQLNNFGQQSNPYKRNNQNIDQQYHSPPTQPPKYTYTRQPNQISLLQKSNTSIANMTKSQKHTYASTKLVELDNIADMYDTSGGTNIEFRKNIDKMRKFYRKMMEDGGREFPGEFIESRVQTPINKLRDLDDYQGKTARTNVHLDSLDEVLNDKPSPKQKRSNNNEQTNKKQKKKKPKKQNNTNFTYNSASPPSYPYPYPYPYSNQPQIIMIPPYNGSPSPSPQTRRQTPQQIKYYQKLIQMKNKENKQLLAMLLSLKQGHKAQKFQQQALKHSKITQSPIPTTTDKYYFEQQLNPNLSPQQKILIALQRQQLDQLRLLSSLPQHLQQIKMQSVMKIIETRTQLQKQILEQKVRNLEQQETNQLYEEERKLRNDEWVSNERKRMIGHQMGQYLDNFKKKIQQGDNQSDSDDQDQDQQQQQNLQ